MVSVADAGTAYPEVMIYGLLARVSVRDDPALMAGGIALTISNTRAVLEGLAGHQSGFVRTPKYGVVGGSGLERWRYTSRAGLLVLGELGLALYLGFVVQRAWELGLYWGLPFLLLFMAGFLYTGLSSLLQPWLNR